ncbi:MAG: glycosyltransferase family 4 protein [Methanothrix sp.]|jgi:glycosyltransferase involved in cell wall biosynthesis|nr:glycosyltransferase family 4 protein [Methanothrix sp.]
MRIAYMSLEFPPRIFGGLGVYVDEISREMVSLGESISVFTLGDGKLKRYQDMDGVEVFREVPVPIRDGLEIFLSPETLSWGKGLYFLLDLFSLNQLAAARLMENGPFDLCVAHDWLGLLGAMAVKKEGIPMIYHVHGLEVGRSDNPNPQLVALEKKGAEVADLIITVSEAMKQELVILGVRSEKVRVCYHGVDAAFFNPDLADPKRLTALRKRYGFAKDDVIVLFMGRLECVKGIVQLFSAISRVQATHPRLKLLVVGKGSLESWALSEAKRLGCITLVTDFLDAEDKMHHYALADLCVFPSLYEPFGIVALEAAAMGKAAVVGAAGTSGLAEIVKNPGDARPTGVHVNARDPRDIAWGINLALEDLDRLKSWGENARARVLEEFTWQKAAERTLAIYKEVT